MERKYAAFISYRHLPLDMAVAEKLHRLIERYRIPRDLRKNDEKHLGLVFRDRDELPLSSNLKQDIYDALDHSEYLIVICTPDTPKSLWVRQEIEYFIRVHGRERVLTVLAAGTPGESIPDCITTVYAEDGTTVLERIEPLCAFLADDRSGKVLRNLRSEFPRLVAAILGCPYDSIIQRHKRYRTQRAMLALGAVAAVSLMMIGLLARWNLDVTEKNREISGLNRQIGEQLIQTQLNESKALTLLSENQLDAGERMDAVASALSALEGERPYYAPAEAALADALFVYQSLDYRPAAAFDMPNEITDIAFSPCGRYAIMDNAMYLVLYDLAAREEIWRVNSPSDYRDQQLYIDPELEYFLLLHPEGGSILSFETGDVLLDLADSYDWIEFLAASSDAGMVALRLYGENTVILFDARARRELLRITFDDYIYFGEFSGEGAYLYLFSSGDSETQIHLIDCVSGGIGTVTVPGFVSDCTAPDDGSLIVMSEHSSDGCLYCQYFRVDTAQSSVSPVTDRIAYGQRPVQILASDRWLYSILTNSVQIFSLDDGSLAKHLALDGGYIDFEDGCAGLDPMDRLVITRDNGIYLVQGTQRFMGSYFWNCTKTYESTYEISSVYYGGDWLALTSPDFREVRFLCICGDANGVPAEAQPESKLSAGFEDGILTLQTTDDPNSVSVPCPYDRIKDDLYVQRTVYERFELDYSMGFAELYAGQNGTVIVCYYEGGLQGEDMYTFDTPEAYAIYSREHDSWNWFENEALGDTSLGIFFTNHAPGFAIVSGNNDLKLYDFESNAVILEMQVPLTYLSGIRFSSDDRYALAFDSTRYQSVILDIPTGEVIAAFDFLPYLYDDNFDFCVTENRIYIEQVSPDGVHDYGVIIDRESREVIAKVPNMEYYDPGTDRIVCTANGTLFSYPAYTTQDLIDIGTALIAGGE